MRSDEIMNNVIDFDTRKPKLTEPEVWTVEFHDYGNNNVEMVAINVDDTEESRQYFGKLFLGFATQFVPNLFVTKPTAKQKFSNSDINLISFLNGALFGGTVVFILALLV